MGHEVETMSESDFCSSFAHSIHQVNADCIFGMYRNAETLELLSRVESQLAIPCINSVRGINNASRVSNGVERGVEEESAQIFGREPVPFGNQFAFTDT